jgi:hypothetical protein
VEDLADSQAPQSSTLEAVQRQANQAGDGGSSAWKLGLGALAAAAVVVVGIKLTASETKAGAAAGSVRPTSLSLSAGASGKTAKAGGTVAASPVAPSTLPSAAPATKDSVRVTFVSKQAGVVVMRGGKQIGVVGKPTPIPKGSGEIMVKLERAGCIALKVEVTPDRDQEVSVAKLKCTQAKSPTTAGNGAASNPSPTVTAPPKKKPNPVVNPELLGPDQD